MTVHASHAPFSRVFVLPVLLGAAVQHACVLETAGTGRRTQEQPNPTEAEAGTAPEQDAAVLDAAEPIDAGGADASGIDIRVDAASQRDTGVLDAIAVADGQSPADAADARAIERDATVDPRTDAAVDPPPVDAAVDAATVDAATPGCMIDGTFAVQLSYDVNWQGTTIAGVIPLLRAGRGNVKVWARIDLRERGGRGRVQGCGTSLPDFASGSPRIGTELYSAFIPSASWDKPTMPRWDLRFQLGCHEAGCSVKSGLTLTTVGARLSGTSVWPGPDGSLANLLLEDHDGDGYPGISLLTRGPNEANPAGTAYDHPPLSWMKSARASQLMMAVQIAFELDGALSDCDTFGGNVREGRVENRIASCVARNGQNGQATLCTPEQARFADENLPEWTVNSATFRAVRIAPASTCGAVRAAVP